MKINAIMLIKDHVDIVEEALLYAMKFCHRIYIYDNHSTDGSWELVNEMASRFKELVIFGQTDEPSNRGLLNRIYNRYHNEYTNEDWWYVLHPDELLSESPQEYLKSALLANKNAMNVWLARFYLTNQEVTEFESENVNASIVKRRKYYSVNKSEPRFFTNDPVRKWEESSLSRIPAWATSVSKDFVVSRSYPMRTPQQVEKLANKPMALNDYPCASSLNEYQGDGHFIVGKSVKLRALLTRIRGAFLKKLGIRVSATANTVKHTVTTTKPV